MLNNVVLVGRLTKDVQLRKTQSNKSVTSFNLAVKRDKDNTDFIDCVAWGQTAEVLCQYMHKGSMIGLKGRIQTRNYEDVNTHKKVYVTEVVAENVVFLEKKGDEVPSNVADPVIDFTSDDLPF